MASTNANRQDVNSLNNKRITKQHIFVICLVLSNSKLKELIQSLFTISSAKPDQLSLNSMQVTNR